MFHNFFNRNCSYADVYDKGLLRTYFVSIVLILFLPITLIIQIYALSSSLIMHLWWYSINLFCNSYSFLVFTFFVLCWLVNFHTPFEFLICFTPNLKNNKTFQIGFPWKHDLFHLKLEPKLISNLKPVWKLV